MFVAEEKKTQRHTQIFNLYNLVINSHYLDPPLPLSCLRLLVPPLRLVSAVIWETVQQKVVANYGLLDDFVTAVTEIVPELLNRRQRCLLRLGLRAQVLYEEPRIFNY